MVMSKDISDKTSNSTKFAIQASTLSVVIQRKMIKDDQDGITKDDNFGLQI